ncbi:MAG: hypothetical protein LBG25_06640, partial [Spirochaetaceae bacterium]|nr:hypothetical protein [Spirochaetaceae bacterium]
MSQGFSGNAAVVAEYRMFRFLGLQAEAIFNYDAFKVAKITEDPGRNIRSTDKFRAMSLMVPLLIKVPLAIGKFVLSPFGGVYYTMPLGSLKMEPDDSSVGQAGSF